MSHIFQTLSIIINISVININYNGQIEFTTTLIVHGCGVCGRPHGGVGVVRILSGADKGVGDQNQPIFCRRPLCTTPKVSHKLILRFFDLINVNTS